MAGWAPRRAALAARAVTAAFALAVVSCAASWWASLAVAGPAKRVVHFHGRAVRVPAGWRVFKLADHPRMCARMDRRAVYLGTPSPNQRCPAGAIGRRRAILVGAAAARRASAPDPAGAPAAEAGASAAESSGIGVPPSRGSASSSTVFTGLGFDACAAPPPRTMSAWAASPYRAIGIYIGGLNRACAQPNLTAEWVAAQIDAGWRLIPTYVGRQAPTSSCRDCAKLSARRATAQGAAAAEDAVEQAQAIGIGPGNPIYFDMESYTRTASASRATLAFLAAWTVQLHALGYESGVYSSSSSGIADLAKEIGLGYQLPDNIWIANWNGRANTDDPFVPDSAWADHQRLHQFRGGHNETYRGVTINIDTNYVDGATVGSAEQPALAIAGVATRGSTVSVTVRCGLPKGTPCPGQIILRTHVRAPAGGKRRRSGAVRVVRVAVARRAFRIAGGRSHTFRVALNERGRPLLRKRGRLRAQLLVAIPGIRASRAVELVGR